MDRVRLSDWSTCNAMLMVGPTNEAIIMPLANVMNCSLQRILTLTFLALFHGIVLNQEEMTKRRGMLGGCIEAIVILRQQG